MSYKPKANPQNVPGTYYVTEDCLACESSQEAAPTNFRYGDNGMSYVFKQPSTTEEEERCGRALEMCPMEAVRNDGESNALGIRSDE